MTSTRQRLRPLLTHPIREAIHAAKGAASYLLVGGVIRDLLVFDRVAQDWDLIVTEAPAFARRLAEHVQGRLVRLGGARHNLFRVVTGEMQIDLQEPLADDLEGELRRRDLTVNSIALDLAHDTLHDPLGGCADVSRRILRANSATVFSADALRVVRLFRFATTLPGFVIEERTAELALSASPELRGIAVERIREELHQALSAGRIPRLGSLLSDLGLFPVLWECGRLWEAGRSSDRALAGSVEALDALDAVFEWTERQLGAPHDPLDLEAARHAALISAAGGDVEAGEIARRLAEQGLLTARLAGRIEKMTPAVAPPADEVSRRRLIHGWGGSWPVAAALRTWQAPEADRDRWNDAVTALALTAKRGGAALFEPTPLLTGHQLHEEFGLPAGTEMGRVLADLKEAQVAGYISTPTEARRWLRREREARGWKASGRKVDGVGDEGESKEPI